MKKYLHDTGTKHYIEDIYHQFPDLKIIYIAEYRVLHKKLNKVLQEPNWPFVSFCNLKSLFYLLLFVLICCTTPYHKLSLIVICCHSLLLDLSLVAIHCHSLYHSLPFVVSLVVIRCTTRCHSLLLVVPPVVTRCTTLCLFVIEWFLIISAK